MISGFNFHLSCTPKWSKGFETNTAGQQIFSDRLLLGAMFTNGTNTLARKGLKNHIFTIVLHQSETLPTESQAKCWFTVLDIAVNSNASQVKRINNERIIMFTFHLFTTERSIQRQALPGVFPVSHKRIISGLKTNLNLSPSYSFHKSLYHKSLVLEPQLNVKYLI